MNEEYWQQEFEKRYDHRMNRRVNQFAVTRCSWFGDLYFVSFGDRYAQLGDDQA